MNLNHNRNQFLKLRCQGMIKCLNNNINVLIKPLKNYYHILDAVHLQRPHPGKSLGVRNHLRNWQQILPYSICMLYVLRVYTPFNESVVQPEFKNIS